MTEKEPAALPTDPVLITGTTSGIGRSIAENLAAKGVPLILHVRDRKRGEELVAELKLVNNGALLELEVADLASQREVKQLAKSVADRHPSLSAVVNNAGVIAGAYMLTEDAVELGMAVNHVAPFMLTQLLKPQLVAGGGGRVVNVNSFLHKRGKLELNNLRKNEGGDSLHRYSNTKLASLLATYAWARKLEAEGVTVNAYNPGIVRTNMLPGGIVKVVAPLIAKSPKTAATTAAFLAISPRVAGLTGGYFAATGVRKASSKISRDEDLQDKVFDATLELVKG